MRSSWFVLIACTVGCTSPADNQVEARRAPRPRLALAAGSTLQTRVYAGDTNMFRVVYEDSTNAGYADQLYWIDTDGDGLDELVYTTSRETAWSPVQRFLVRTHDDGPLGLSHGAESTLAQTDWTAGLDDNHDGDGDVVLVGADWGLSPPTSYEALYTSSGGILPVDRSWTGSVFPEDYPGPPLAGDLDGDGYPEVVVAFSSGGYVVHATASGLTPMWSNLLGPTGWVYPMALVDLDGDGRLDMLSGENTDGWGTPTSLVARSWDGSDFRVIWSMIEPPFTAIAWGDFAGDAEADLAMCESDGLHLYRRALDGLHPVPVVPSQIDCGALALGDYDGDGDLDLAVGGNSLHVFENLGGAFALAFVDSSTSAWNLAWGRCTLPGAPGAGCLSQGGSALP